MSPLPVCTVLDNPPDDAFDNDMDENFENNIHVIANSSDSEDEEDFIQSENGYHLLPQEPVAVDSNENIPQNSQSSNQENVTSQAQHQHNIFNLLSPMPSTGDESVILWNETVSQNHQPMEPDEAEKIKAAMSGFSLPPSAVPAWAHLIPEDEWKAQLFANIRGKCPVDKKEIFDKDR